MLSPVNVRNRMRQDSTPFKMSLLVHGAKQIVQITQNGELFKKGKDMKDIAILNKPENEGLSLAANK